MTCCTVHQSAIQAAYKSHKPWLKMGGDSWKYYFWEELRFQNFVRKEFKFKFIFAIYTYLDATKKEKEIMSTGYG